MSDYWSQPYPRKGVIRDSVKEEGAPPPKADAVRAPEPRVILKTTAPQNSPTVGPFEDWPEPPKGTLWTMVGLEGDQSIASFSSCFFSIQPQRLFKGMYLHIQVERARHLLLEEYRVGNRSQFFGGRGSLPVSIFRRPVPWKADTAQIGNVISFQLRSLWRYSLIPRITVIGLVVDERLRMVPKRQADLFSHELEEDTFQ